METVMITDHIELAKATICFFHDKQSFETEER